MNKSGRSSSCSITRAMLLVYLLVLVVLLSSSSACHATSRNHRLLFSTADVPAPATSPPTSPSLPGDDHRVAIMRTVWSSPYAMTMEKPQEPPPPPPPDLEMLPGAGAVERAPATTATATATEQQEDAVAMVPLPAADGGYVEVGGGDGHERSVDDAGVDYAPPKTHPPSHN